MKKFLIGSTIFSALIFVSALPNVAKAQPNLESVTATVNLNIVTIAWTTDISTTGLLEYGTSSGNYTKQVTTDFDTSHSVYLNNLAENTTYYYRVTATDEEGASTQSAEQTFLTENVLLAYRSITEVIRSSNRAVIKVVLNQRGTPSVYFGTNPEALTKRAEYISTPFSIAGTQTGYFLLGSLKPGTTYYYQAISYCPYSGGCTGESAFSDIRSLRTRGVTRITSVSRSGQNIIIQGLNFGESSSDPLIVAVGIGCSLSTWPTSTPRCLADIVSWSDSRIVAKFKSSTPRNGIVYVAKKYTKPSFGGYVHLFTVKGPSL